MTYPQGLVVERWVGPEEQEVGWAGCPLAEAAALDELCNRTRENKAHRKYSQDRFTHPEGLVAGQRKWAGALREQPLLHRALPQPDVVRSTGRLAFPVRLSRPWE